MIESNQPDHALDTNVAAATPTTGAGATGAQAAANQVNPTDAAASNSDSHPVAAPEGISPYVQTATDGKSDNPVTDAVLNDALSKISPEHNATNGDLPVYATNTRTFGSTTCRSRKRFLITVRTLAPCPSMSMSAM